MMSHCFCHIHLSSVIVYTILIVSYLSQLDSVVYMFINEVFCFNVLDTVNLRYMES